MSLLSRAFRKILRNARASFYRKISTARVEGKCKAVCPLLCEGRGTVFFGNKAGSCNPVTIGFVEDAGFWNTYAFLNPRNPGSQIAIGEGSQICNGFTAVSEGEGDQGGIVIGKNVLVGSQVSVYDSDFHEIAPDKRIGGSPKMGRVTIADNVWIGDRVMILKGTTIGENSVVAAGAVVCGDFPANVIIGGVPAKVIRSI